MRDSQSVSESASLLPPAALPVEDYWLTVDAMRAAEASRVAEVVTAIGIYRNSIHYAGRIAAMISTTGARLVSDLGMPDHETLDFHIATAANYEAILRSVVASQKLAA